MEVREAGANYGFTEVQDAPAGYKQTEVGFIPEDWVLEPLAALLKFKNGLNKSKEFFGYGTPIVNYMDVYSHSALRAADIRGRVDVTPQELDAFSVRPGDVFFTRTSETVDEIGVACVLLDNSPKTVFSGFVLRGRPRNNVLVDTFKKYCFSSSIFREQVVSKSTYTTRALTSGRVLSGIGLPFPPDKAEQEAIAEALSDADALIESLEQLVAKKRQIKQGTMQALLTGKRRLPRFSRAWSDLVLGDVIEELEAGVSVNSTKENPSPDVPCILKTSAVSGGIFVPSECKVIARDERWRARSSLVQGTILISRMNTPDLVGEVAYVDKDYPFLFLPDRVWMTRFRADFDVDAKWLAFLLSGCEYSRRIKDSATGTSGSMKNISKSALLAIRIAVPCVEEQTAIATILSDMDTELAELETRLAKTRQLKQGMMQELLTGRIRLV